jgi:rubrerythrin
MNKFNTIDEILDFAIESEQKAVDFYTRLAEQAKNEDIKEVFLSYAREEMGHKAKLTKIKEGNLMGKGEEEVQDLKIADYLERVEATEEMSYEEALVLAMKREKAAFRLYTTLASKTDDTELRDVFLMLAQEEAKHKLRFEVEYDEHIYREN